MTREEAIKVLSTYDMSEDNDDTEFKDAVAMAIKALSQEPICIAKVELDENKLREIVKEQVARIEITAEQEPCDDVISREAVLKKQYRIDDSATLSTRDVVNVEDIEDMPPVTQKSGKWINKDVRKEEYVLTGKCSVCGQVRVKDKFCSNCGAKMESEDKE